MGYRTVLTLSNDEAHAWTNDPELGRKIMAAASIAPHSPDRAREFLPYGTIIEQVHADTQTVAFLDGYSGKPMAYSHWHRAQSNESRDLEMLKALAEEMGYRIVKKAK